jgi:hypothetical protein
MQPVSSFRWLSHSKYCSLWYIKIQTLPIFAMNCSCKQTFHLLKKISNIRAQMPHIWVQLCVWQLPQLHNILVSLTTATSTTWHAKLVSAGNRSYIYVSFIAKTNLNYYIFLFPACQNTFNLQSCLVVWFIVHPSATHRKEHFIWRLCQRIIKNQHMWRKWKCYTRFVPKASVLIFLCTNW